VSAIRDIVTGGRLTAAMKSQRGKSAGGTGRKEPPSPLEESRRTGQETHLDGRAAPHAIRSHAGVPRSQEGRHSFSHSRMTPPGPVPHRTLSSPL
jgi:hypothetical protein